MEKMESNGAAKAEYPRIVIKKTRDSVKTPCAICGETTRAAEASLDLYIEGNDREVCLQCGKKYEPRMVKALATWWNVEERASPVDCLLAGLEAARAAWRQRPSDNDIPS